MVPAPIPFALDLRGELPSAAHGSRVISLLLPPINRFNPIRYPKPPMTNRLTLIACCLVFLATYDPAFGGDWGAYLKDRERKGMSVPLYCKAKFQSSFPELTKQQEADAKRYLGGSFLHAHHFCLALMHIWDMEAEGKLPNPGLANKTIKEITYYSSRTPQDHPIMVDVHRAFAKAYRYLGDDATSKAHYEQSLQAYSSPAPGTSPGTARHDIYASADRYVEMADKMMRLGLPGEAAALLQLALQIQPDSKLIQAKLKIAQAAGNAKAPTGSKP